MLKFWWAPKSAAKILEKLLIDCCPCRESVYIEKIMIRLSVGPGEKSKVSSPGMPSVPKTKKSKPNCDISGLRNQARATSLLSELSNDATPPCSQAPSSDDGDESDLEADDKDLFLLIHFDSLKTNLQREEKHPDALEQMEDEEYEEWEGFSSEDLADGMIDMYLADDHDDLDWMPQKM